MLHTLIDSAFVRALKVLGVDDTAIPFEKPRQAGHGHVSTTVCMMLAKKLGKNPRALAQEIVDALELDSSLVSDIQIAGPGFINITFTPKAFQFVLGELNKAGVRIGFSEVGNGKTVNVEYVSANPTGPLHAGHGRNCVLGDSIASLYMTCGYEVTREYYFNNAGNQMAMLGKSIASRYKQIDNPSNEFVQDGYLGDYISDIARNLHRTDALTGLSEEDQIDICKKAGEEWCFASIKATLETLGIQHDLFFNEDSLYSEGAIQKTIEALRSTGLVYDREGAVWFELTKLGHQADKVIVKSSGEPTYRLPDIAYHKNKLERGFDVVVDVFGSDHIATIPDVLAGVKALGFETDKVRVVIHQMVTFIENGEVVKFSKRSGNAYTLSELIDEVGSDVVRFFFAMRAPGTHLEFDLDLAKEEGDKNPVFYLQYAHARICSVIEKATEKGLSVSLNADLTPLTHDSELELIDILSRFKTTVEKACEILEPHILAEYLKDMAAAYHAFYHNCRIIGSVSEVESARLLLADVTRRAVKNGLEILGVKAPERM